VQWSGPLAAGESVLSSCHVLFYRGWRKQKNVRCPENDSVAYRIKYIHDLCLVRTLKNLNDRKWYIAALASWGIALFEYLLQVPANRIGYTQFSVAQLKITQEVITLSVFAPFAMLYLREPMKLDYLWAGLCLLGAVYFMFRS
jgi:uncharacterized protein (DUF486 family)